MKSPIRILGNVFFKVKFERILYRILGFILVIGDILYAWHLGFNSATFSQWENTLWIVIVGIIGLFLAFTKVGLFSL